MKKLMLVAVALASCAAFADKITLKSGSTLSGTAGEIAGDKLKFASDDLGDILVPLANIANIDSARKHVVAYLDGNREEKVVGIENGELRDGSGKLDMSKVKAIDPAPETWHGNINVAFNAERGNSYENSASVIANLNRRWDSDRLNFNFGYYYTKSGASRDESTKSKDKIEVEGQYDHFWTKRFYNYVNARYDRDVIQGLDRRFKLGAGFGWQWLENRSFDLTGRWNFNQELGAAYMSDSWKDEQPDRKDDYATVRYAHHLKYEPKWTKGLEIFHNFEYLPEVDDFEIYLVNADVGISTMVFWNINLIAKIDWEFNSKPCAGRDKHDVRYMVGFGYKW